MYHLTESQRGEIIGLYKNNQPISKISKTLKVHRTTVSRTIKKYINKDNLATCPRTGRPKLLTCESQKTLKTIVKNNNKNSAEQNKKKYIKKKNIKVYKK